MKLEVSKGTKIVIAQDIYKYITKTYAAVNAERILNDFCELDQIQALSKRDNYVISSHKNGIVQLPVDKDLSRLEEWTCKNMVINKPILPGADFGILKGYQIPLKTPKLDNPEINGGLGKIDILSQKADTAFILELKVEKSTEHPLRAFLEAYTYWKLLGGNNAQEFLIRSDANTAKRLDKAIVIYDGSPIHMSLLNLNRKIKDYENPINMEQRIKIEKEIEDNSKVMELIRKLDVSCFLIKRDVSDNEVSFSYVGKQKI